MARSPEHDSSFSRRAFLKGASAAAVVGPVPVAVEPTSEPDAGDTAPGDTAPGDTAPGTAVADPPTSTPPAAEVVDEPPADAESDPAGGATGADGDGEATTVTADVSAPEPEGTGPVTTSAPALLHTEPAQVATLRTPTADDPLRVLLVGDSYMYDAEPAIAAAMSATGVVAPVQSSRLGFTITGDGWEETLTGLVETHRPELVVAMWARFDAEWLETHEVVEYEQLLDRAFGILTADGATLAFVGLAPSLGAGVDREPVDRTINEVFVGATASYGDRAFYVDPDPVVAPDGEPDRWLETAAGRLLVRKPDVSHYCGDGAARFGLAMAELVGRLTDVSPADPALWWAADWRADDRYHEPVGVCAA